MQSSSGGHRVLGVSHSEIPSPLQAGGGRSCVLLVDDDEAVRRMAARALKGRYDVVEAVDGRDGLGKFEAGKFSVVLCDRTMPNMGGDETIREIKRISPNQPVIMLSGEVESLSSDLRRSIGADIYLAKPYQLKDLFQSIDSLTKNKV
jgi:CheY-like chemotaxis protein